MPVQLPFLPFDEKRVLSNVGALQIPEVPKHLIVIGGGVIGLELGSVWRRLGAKVTVVEFAPTILPGNDDDVIKEADRIFRKQGLDIHVGTKVTGAEVRADGVTIHAEKDGAALSFDGDYVLVSVGRKPSLDIVYTDLRVSVDHLLLTYTAGGVCARDLSTNGTFVNGERMECKVDTMLRDGDVREASPTTAAAGPRLTRCCHAARRSSRSSSS